MGQQGRARFGAPKALVVVETEIHDVVWWVFFFFSSRRRHTRFDCDWSSDVCSSDLLVEAVALRAVCRLARPPCGRGGCEQRRPGCVAGAGGLARGRQQCRGSARRCVDRKSTRLNSSHSQISYAVFCLKKKNNSATLPSHLDFHNGYFLHTANILRTRRPIYVAIVHLWANGSKVFISYCFYLSAADHIQ